MERDLVTNETALRELLQRAVAALDDAGQQPSLLQPCRGSSEEALANPPPVLTVQVTALAGSRGDTAEQILAALGATHEEELLHEFGIVGRVLEPLSPLHVGLASKMYLSTSLELADSFKEAIHQEFGGQVKYHSHRRL
ncbi:hypothetical protein HPB52_011080 [Rhipicephalus sanguineus]|uniref:Serpin domain-containing protein n=1 Tax=Rhipicephalus sanguineus TaxID=34632 RepID=A0A9D4Q9Q4_RHISA|nr:hypothetical protein HPB52_011080 [Rhipicephalus sanguineus]